MALGPERPSGGCDLSRLAGCVVGSDGGICRSSMSAPWPSRGADNPANGNSPPVFETDEPIVGKGDAVRVVGKNSQDLLGSAERVLGVDRSDELSQAGQLRDEG